MRARATAIGTIAGLAITASVLPAALPAQAAGSDLLSSVHVGGRVVATDSSLRFTWPGVYVEGRFRGTGVGIRITDTVSDFDVQVDGKQVTTLSRPGDTTAWVRNLSSGEHTVRLAKRSESPWAATVFGGFVADTGGQLLGAPTASRRQIEFIGDSYTAGYGNMSTTRDCSANGGVDRNTNADQSFGALTARGLSADYQINAWSGMGVVRNYNGGGPEANYRTYYNRTLQQVSSDVDQPSSSWRPQVVVIGLGINDFSTAVHAGEKWANESALVSDYTQSYQSFLAQLRERYGSNTILVVSATPASSSTTFQDAAQKVVQARNSAGDKNVKYWYYADSGLDKLGCDWHPSLADHKVLAQRLTSFLSGLSIGW